MVASTSASIHQAATLEYLVFRWQGLLYAVEARQVWQILRLPALTPMEEVPPWVVGMLDLAGTLVPVVDLQLRLGHARIPYRLQDALLVLQTRGGRVAVVVHEVLDVALGRRLLSAQSEVQNGIHPILSGAMDAGGQVCMLLDPEALMAQAGASLTSRDALASDLFPEATEAQRAVWRERARILAEPEAQVSANAGRAVVVASLGGELFAIALEEVQELTRFCDPAPIPCCPPHVVGHIPLRGDIVTLIDLRGILGLPLDPPWTHGDLIVCEVQGLLLGVPVEQVVDVLRMQDKALTPVPSVLGGGMETHLLGILKHAGRPVTLIDLRGLLEGSELVVDEGA